ncbi:hypothetical protein PINS_up001909 [Pythium insidiosum]|nr:hypothetical protein PINS_up001909 [Pythium insidiosum]
MVAMATSSFKDSDGRGCTLDGFMMLDCCRAGRARYTCNALQNVVVGNGFQHLEVLNASFNCLSSKDIDQLSTLLRIRELYVSHNWIRTLPPVMDRFSRLETLSLEQNGISGDEVFNFLAIIHACGI